MKYVAVRHKPEHQNVWFFKVPEVLNEYVQIGNKVICDTRYGLTKGRIEYILDGVPDTVIEQVADCNPSNFIVGVESAVSMEDITVPLIFDMSTPDSSKLMQRVHEWYRNGAFNTKVEFHADGELKDGYSAYLVARMFGHETLRGVVFDDRN